MSGAKHRMRSKKMRNQPSSVTYNSPGWRNGGETSQSGRWSEHTPQGKGHNAQPSGWIRGHPVGGNVKAGQAYSQELPKCITASTFAKARAAEVKAMLKAVTKTTGSSHVFGALPKHMRRRAMSHNTKRLPTRLREGAQKMLEKSQQAGQKERKEQPKSKSRKARRRHGNLLLEFNRRQRKNVWLETHIWHAKRFHMVKRWGYCLGHRPTYKCYRACYRAMTDYSLLQDLSYYCCVEVQGEEELLLRAMSRLTSAETVLCLSGRRQGSAVLYRADQYPTQPLGPVLFLWRPRSAGSSHRQLWIWLHPSLKQGLLSDLQLVCQCSKAVVPPTPVPLPAPAADPAPSPMKRPDEEQPTGRKRKRKREEEGSGDTVPVKKILGDGTRSPLTPVTWKSDSTGIVIRDLTMEIVRYRLIGPLSHSVLADALTPASVCEDASKPETSCFWWPEHCKEEDNMSLHQEQADIFHLLKGLCSTGEVPSGSVLGLTVDDPRLTLPGKRIKVAPNLQQLEGEGADRRRALTLQGVPERCCQSALWDQAVRDNVTHNKIPEQELNRMKSSLLVPGSRLQPAPPHGRVPLLLLQQPGKQLGQEMGSWGAGWDLLLPKGWGMAFWVPLVYRGVRVGGLQEALKHSQSKGAEHFPHDFPDCPAGVGFLQEQEARLLDGYKRRPPAKRPNYIKHGCLAPFRCPWQQLAEEWEMIVMEGEEGDLPAPPPHPQPQLREETSAPPPQEVTSRQHSVAPPLSRVIVLRNRKALRTVSAWCRPTFSRGQRWRRPAQLQQLSPVSAETLRTAHPRSLVWVRLCMLRKGSPSLHAMICVPTPEDMQQLRRDPAYCGPQEPPHTDHFLNRTKRWKKGLKPASSTHKQEKKSAEAVSAPSSTMGPESGSAPSSTVGPEAGSAPSSTVGPEAGSAPSSTVGPEAGSAPSSTVGPEAGSAPSSTVGPEAGSAPSSTVGPEAGSAPSSTVGPEAGSAPSSTAGPEAGSAPSSTVGPEAGSAPSSTAGPEAGLTRGLWPDPLPSVTSHCSRVTMGWVTQGDFSLSAGCGEALGFVSLTGLLHALSSQPADLRGLVLLRNPASLQYRFAKINIEV
ncbi:ribonucleases P/MRP protein subunit POP1 isoform X2 [Conger conger]|uniref:ribonucleases P/MRP protein subunit POP1 isoform X2 n=1 Tax=Conger conger TaxID=82655 RepID=UPI002A59F2DD|nr:ribonucleases P/MRP protein subunit POP1 isoform X2 [Conger conger]